MNYRTIFILLLLILLSVSLQAQYKPILLGLKASPNVAWLKPDAEGYSSEGISPGFSWGLGAEFYFMENYAVLTGFDVRWLNGKLEMPYAMDMGNDTLPVFGTLNRKYKFKYIEVPLALKLKAELNEKLRFFGKVGLGTGFRLDTEAEDVFTYEGGTVDDSGDITEETKLLRHSLILGGGIEYVIKGSTAIILDITYNDGFVNILNGGNPADPSIDNKATLKFVELNVGIVF